MRSTNPFRSSLTQALLAFSLAAPAPAFSAGQIQLSVSGLRYGTPAVSAQACQPGSSGSWLEADSATVVGGEERRIIMSFSTPLATDTFHAAINEAGWRDLALIEFRDGNGVWHTVWEGKLAAPTPSFAQQLCVERRLPQKQVMQALSFIFRSGPGEIEVNHAALLRR